MKYEVSVNEENNVVNMSNRFSFYFWQIWWNRSIGMVKSHVICISYSGFESWFNRAIILKFIRIPFKLFLKSKWHLSLKFSICHAPLCGMVAGGRVYNLTRRQTALLTSLTIYLNTTNVSIYILTINTYQGPSIFLFF